MPAESKFDNLTNGNYIEWKIYMEALLVRKNLLEVVNGTERHPGGNEGTKKVKDFYRKQAEAHAEITLRVSPSQLIYCQDTGPYQIWMTLANAHQSCGRSTVLALRRRFHRLHLEKTKTMCNGYTVTESRHSRYTESNMYSSCTRVELRLFVHVSDVLYRLHVTSVTNTIYGSYQYLQYNEIEPRNGRPVTVSLTTRR